MQSKAKKLRAGDGAIGGSQSADTFAATIAAEMALLDSGEVLIPAEDWEKFADWMHSPPIDMPKLRQLANNKLAWEK